MKNIARHPLFIVGLGLRLVLIVGVQSSATQHWFAPFLSYSVRAFSVDPWSAFLNAGGDRLAFPYGYAMWLAFLPLSSLAWLVGAPSAIAYGVTLLGADIAMLGALRRMTGASAVTLLAFYWLSPIVLYATYWQGYNDILPILFLTLSLVAMRDHAPRRAAVFSALAVSAKLSMIVAVPFLLVYLAHNKRLRVFFRPFADALTVALVILQVPYLLSAGGRGMLFDNPEMAKVYDLSLPFQGDLRVYVLPLVYLLVLAGAWHIRRMSFELLLALLGLAFFLVLLLAPAAPGWFVWVLPFLVFYQIKSDRIAIALVGVFSLLYIGLSSMLAPLPSVPMFGWVTVGAKPFEALGLSVHALSLWQTLLLTTGLVLASRMLREGVQANEFFRLSRKPFVLGIAGDSGTGKDTLANSVAALFGPHSVVQVSGDDYHLWDRQKPMWRAMTHINPRANDLTRFAHDVQALSDGRAVYASQYDHVSGKMSQPTWLKSNDFVIVSGLHALYPPLLRELYDLMIYLDMDEPLRRHLKIKRDTSDRAQTREQVMAAIERRESDSRRFVHPQATQADLILSLRPMNPEALGDPGVTLRLKLGVRAREGMYYEGLVRVLIGVCGLHVDIAQGQSDAMVELSVEGETDSEDMALAARELLPQLQELLDVAPVWQGGIQGVIQLIVLTHMAQALRSRLL